MTTVQLRVLLVDDNADAAEMLRFGLELAGHEAETVNDSERALELLERREFDVAVLDIGLPVIDGYELASRIRSMPRHDAMPLIALSGYGLPNDVARSRAAGFALHLVKPTAIPDLTRAIASVLPREQLS